jgi:DNA polymerase-3 subunit epsilon
MSKREEFLQNCLILDVEATGPDYTTAQIIELAFCLRDGDSWTAFDELHKPDDPITPEISAITNITNRMVEDCVPFRDALPAFNDILSKLTGKGFCVAHNVKYDKGILAQHGIIDQDWLCTLRMIRKLYQGDDSVKMHNLPYLRYRFDLEIPEDAMAHRADADALCAAALLEHIVDELENRGIIEKDVDYAPQILEWMESPIIIDTMPFGKHKGKKLADVPISYWTWAFENLDSLDETKESFDKDFADSIAIALGLNQE